MNALQASAVALGAAALAAFGTAMLDTDPPAAEVAGAPALELARELDALRTSQHALAARLDALETRPAAPGGARVDVGGVEEAARRAVEELLAELEAPARPAAAAAGAGGGAELPLDRVLALLRDDALAWLDREELWQELREEGRLDEVIAAFEDMAEDDPLNPDLQVELGYAYIQKIQEVGNSALAGKWAMKADDAFDRALELDPAHWEARFTKAISYSHWPAFTGKPAEAIHELHALLDVQTQGPAEPHHVETYLVLGNLYLGQGNASEAAEVWQQGLALFPGDEELAAKLASVDG